MAIIQPIDPTTFEPQQYSEGDKLTIPLSEENSSFTIEGGRVESAVFDISNTLISYNPNAKFSAIENASGEELQYANTLLVYPEEEVTNLEVSIGTYHVIYNIINNELSSSFNQRFRVKEISANRKEVRLTTSFLSEDELQEIVNEFYPPEGLPETYPDFYLNFGEGNLVIANNILFDGSGDQYSILVKLYKPLPSFVEIDGDFNPWICVLQRDTVGYSVEFEQIIDPIKTTIDLKGPNFSLDLSNQTHTSTKLTNFNELNSPTGLDSSSYSSSYYQLQNILDSKGVNINIDYTDFSNFIHFSSAEERVKNFYYKVGLIESFSLHLSNEETYNSGDKIIKNDITSIISNFDGFEYWMYYNSSSNSSLSSSFPTPYPKKSLNGLPPHKFALTSSSLAIDWYDNALKSASLYDKNNYDALINTIPKFITEDSDNESYLTFIKMIGQHFDTLFTYIQDINNRHNADNRLDFGISKDLVGEAIKSMGVNLYTGNFTSTDLISSLVGINVEGGNINFLPPPEDGSGGVVTNYVTASNFPTPIEDVNKEIYKRIFHNVPLLLKQKGSIAGVRTLINCFGIPKEILDIKEFDINYLSSTQSLALPGSSSSISFPISSIILPPSTSNYIPSELLSPIIRVQQDYLVNEIYDRDLHYTEIGYSPQGYIDESFTGSFSPLGGSFPDYSDFYFGSESYYSTKFITPKSTTADQNVTWDTSAYIRYIKFFDTSLFQMLKDFVPARNSTATGVIIKPTIKERQRQKPPQLTYSNKTYSGSVYSDSGGDGNVTYRAIGDYDVRLKTGSFIYAGGSGGGFENLNRYKFGESGSIDWGGYDLATPITGVIQVASESIHTTLGYAQQTQSTATNTYIKYYNKQEEFYNGEFFQTGQNSVNYLTKEYRNEGTSTGLFTYDNNAQNPYKHPNNVTHSLNSIAVYNSPTELAEAGGITGADLVIANFTDSDIYTLFVKTGTGDLPSSDTLLANGTNFNYSAGGEGYTFGVGSTFLLSDGIYVSITVLEFGSEGYQTLLEQSSIEYLPSFNLIGDQTQPGPWAYNEFNPLINNSFDPAAGLVNYNGIRKSTIFQDADYSPSASSSLNPINTSLLVQGSASKAAVQDSNYASKWWNNSRYDGNKVSSPDFNLQIIRATSNINKLYTSESLQFDPSIVKPTPDQPAVDPGGK